MRLMNCVAVCVTLPLLLDMGGRALAGGAPATADNRQRTKTYTFRGHTVTYPNSWRLRDKRGGAPATIYRPTGAGSLSATWDFDRKTDHGNRTAETIRDAVAESLAATMKGFNLKGKGQLTVDGKAAAFITFEHSVVKLPAVERHVFIPMSDGFVIVVAEMVVASGWEREAAALDRITRSLRFPR